MTADPHRTGLLQRRLADIDDRIKEIDAAPGGTGSFEAQERATEKHSLGRMRLDIISELEAAAAPSKPADERFMRMIDDFERQQRASSLAFIARLEGQGDYRQARVHRLALLHLRERIEKEAGLR